MQLDPSAPVAEPVAPPPAVVDVLESTGLRYGSDAIPGIRREGKPPAFRYVAPGGREIEDEKTLARVRKLVLPPAWTDVWIATDPRSHLQATGRDARGRKQYRYHAKWREERDSNKFERLAAFGRALPAIRRTVERDLARAGLPREKVLATMVALLDRTCVRVGDERYRKANGSYGLTTLRNKHVEVRGETIRLRFRGKSGKEHDIALSDRRLASVVKRCRDLPGQELFRYSDEDGVRSIDAGDVNDYLKAAAGNEYSAKDFRTWGATVIAAAALAAAATPRSDREATRTVNQAIRRAAEQLGNTLAVCRRSYIHPGVLDCKRIEAVCARRTRPVRGLSSDERRVLALLDDAARDRPDDQLAVKLARSVAQRRPARPRLRRAAREAAMRAAA
jgi:DNA topoisomerase-1